MDPFNSCLLPICLLGLWLNSLEDYPKMLKLVDKGQVMGHLKKNILTAVWLDVVPFYRTETMAVCNLNPFLLGYTYSLRVRDKT